MSNRKKSTKTNKPSKNNGPKIFPGYVESQRQVFAKPHGKCKILNVCIDETGDRVTLLMPNKVGFFPIGNHDAITAVGTLITSGEYANAYLISQLPAGMISYDDEVLGKVLNACIYDNCEDQVTVDTILKIVNSIAASAKLNNFPNDTFGYLEYCANKLASMITTPGIVDLVERLKLFRVKARGFIYTWYRKRSKRQLTMFHPTINDIEWYEPDKLIDMLDENPFTLPIISPDVALSIAKRYGYDMMEDDIKYHNLSNYIYTKMKSNSWTCLPIKYIPIQMLVGLDLHDENILAKYYMVKDDDMLYLKYAKLCEESLTVEFKKYLTEGEQILKARPINIKNENGEDLENTEKIPIIGDLQDIFDLADYMEATNDDMANNYDKEVDSSLIDIAKEAIKLGEEQREAIKLAFTNRLSIIGGSAGTGKTKLMGFLAKFLNDYHLRYVACSFTGKAVSRLSKCIPRNKCTTIHRILSGLDIVDYDIVIVDETSMISLPLLYKLLSNRKIYRIICVGDIKQLPPIEWGYLFSEMMKCKLIPTRFLTRNYRVENNIGSNIIHNAFEVSMRNFTFRTGDDFCILHPNQLEELLISFRDQGISYENQILLSPFKKHVEDRNTFIQGLYFNRDKPEVISYDGRMWFVGDKVMNTCNNYKEDIMNGEEGRVTKTYPAEGWVEVDFDYDDETGMNDDEHRIVIFDAKKKDNKEDMEEYVSQEEIDENNAKKKYSRFTSIDKVVHAYSSTIHKSQGSEWSFVLIYNPNPNKFVTRKLMYTGFTRAQTMVIYVGDPRNVAFDDKKPINTFAKHMIRAMPEEYELASKKQTEDEIENQDDFDYDDIEAFMPDADDFDF